MTSDQSNWTGKPREIGRFSFDLIVTLVLTVIAGIVVSLPSTGGSPLAVIFGLPLLLFLPGYALVSMLFPSSGVTTGESTQNERQTSSRERVDSIERVGTIERVVLSAIGSVALAVLVGVALNFTAIGVRHTPVFVTLCAFTVAMTAIAVLRRSKLPEQRRYGVSTPSLLLIAPTSAEHSGLNRDFALSALVAFSLLFAASTAVYAVAFPQKGETYTEVSLLTENDAGELVARGYPTEFNAGENRELVVGLANKEQTSMQYTVVVEAQRVERESGQQAVVESEELARFHTELAASQTEYRRLELAPTLTGGRLRLRFLVYRGDAPAEPSAETAYRDLHLWITVNESEQERPNEHGGPTKIG